MRGAQIVLLSQHPLDDFFLSTYIEDLKSSTNNELIYAEQVDLSSLHSIRRFATKWVDNAPPRRLDMIILCADVMTPYWSHGKTTEDGLEEEWMINYLANFHLLSILSPAIRAQPPDRDVRIIFSTCSSYIGGKMNLVATEQKTKSGRASYARSKLAIMVFATAFQKHLDVYVRPDKNPMNAKTFIVHPGFCRTPGMRRWLSGGSLFGLLIYLATWPLWWLILKSPDQGAQTYMKAAMEAEYATAPGGKLLKECQETEVLKTEVRNDETAKTLWEFSEKQIERLEKAGAVKRTLDKKEKEGKQNGGPLANGASSRGTNRGTAKQKAVGSRSSKKSG